MSDLHPISGCANGARLADVVFVHGLGGNAVETWRYGKEASTSWPHWLGEEFSQVGVWSLGYAASPSKWTRFLGWFSRKHRDAGYALALQDRAWQVLDRMMQRGVGQRPILFICHSLGGLLVKQILRKALDSPDPRRRQVFESTRAVLFLGTPHAGATLASLVDVFRDPLGSTASIDDLRAHNPLLRELFDWFRDHSAEIATVTYYETRKRWGLFTVVNPTSSHSGVGAAPVPLDENHVSIAKPRTNQEPVCDAARDLLRRYVLAPPEVHPEVPPAPPVLPALSIGPQERALGVEIRTPPEVVLRLEGLTVTPRERRIPHELPPAAERYFGRQEELRQLTERLRSGKNTAVVGPAGLGKTALAAEAVRAVVGDTESPYLDGVVFLDLYTFHGQAEAAWNTLANKLDGSAFLERAPARTRAAEACQARRILVIIEGGEEADGEEGRTTIPELFSVLSPENRWLLLTRRSNQAAAAESVVLREALHPTDAGALLDSLTGTGPGRGRLPAEVRQQVLGLLEGHPLALTWAGNLLGLDEEDPARLVAAWKAHGLRNLRDPTEDRHTLEWLFHRSVRGLQEPARQALEAAGLLAHAPFPLAAVAAALGNAEPGAEEAAREALKSLIRRGLLRRPEEADHWQFTHVLGYQFARKETGSDAALRDRLGRWLHGHLEAAMAPQAVTGGLGALPRPLEHTAALLRADDDQRLWRPLADYVLYDGRTRLEALGSLALVKLALEAFAGWLEGFPAAKAQELFWLRERAALVERQGNLQLEQGDLDGGLSSHREALAIAQRLSSSDPSNTQWQRDLGVSHHKLGGVLSAQGDLPGALSSYREALAITQRLSSSDPSNSVWQRDLSVSHNRVGDVLHVQGDLSGTLLSYQESLALRQRLWSSEPSNTEWQRDVSVGHNRVGDVLRAQGDLSGALASYRESLSLRQHLSLSDPSNTEWQRDLSVSHEKVGNVLRAQGDLPGAQWSHQESLSLRQRLSSSDPSNTNWQRDLFVSLYRLAEIHEQQGDRAAALAFAEESLEIAERLAALDSTNATWQQDVVASRVAVGYLREKPFRPLGW